MSRREFNINGIYLYVSSDLDCLNDEQIPRMGSLHIQPLRLWQSTSLQWVYTVINVPSSSLMFLEGWADEPSATGRLGRSPSFAADKG
jgi:hypothetical protein